MEETNDTIYDDVFRTIQERHPQLLIPLINEAFHTDYSGEEPVTRLPEEYQKVVSKVVADGCSVIQNLIYHMECQSIKDGSMILRMVEYDFMIALSQAETEGRYQIQFPYSCIFYLRHNKNTQEEEQMKIIFSDGQTVTYKVPVIKAQKYSREELFRKKLYICLPYYIMRYEKEFHRISQNEELISQLAEEFEEILTQLWEETKQEKTGLYQDLLRLTRRVMDYQLRKEEALKERMGKVMGGKVLELPSDKLREAKSQGMSQGEARVNQLILILQEKNRAGEIILAASDPEYQKKLFEEFGI